jgi:hypothetical protein
MLEVVLPLTIVLSTVDMLIFTYTIGLVISPISFINVSINMNESALALCLILSPFSNVLSSIGPLLLPITISEAALPLS